MSAQKTVRLQAESSLRKVTVQNRKNILSYQWKGVFLFEILVFFYTFVSAALILVFSSNLQLYEIMLGSWEGKNEQY